MDMNLITTSHVLHKSAHDFSLNNFEWVYYTQTWYWSAICYLYPRSQKCSA